MNPQNSYLEVESKKTITENLDSKSKSKNSIKIVNKSIKNKNKNLKKKIITQTKRYKLENNPVKLGFTKQINSKNFLEYF